MIIFQINQNSVKSPKSVKSPSEKNREKALIRKLMEENE